MTKPQHPYPEHVRVAVAETIGKQVLVMREWSDLTAQTREAFLKDADQVLDTLWESNQPSTLSADEVRTIWSHALQIRNGDHEGLHGLRLLLVKHAPDWGEQP